jgi:hypothetical protein
MKRINQNIDKDEQQGYPSYPPTEDIYGKFQKARNVNPEDPSKTKDSTVLKNKKSDEESYSESGDDLDIPGSELDDDVEVNGDEDEENNYYSLGGDNHNDLEEDYNDYN